MIATRPMKRLSPEHGDPDLEATRPARRTSLPDDDPTEQTVRIDTTANAEITRPIKRLSPADTEPAEQLAYVIQQFSPISLAEMQRVALLDRVDTKYLLGLTDLQTVLQQINTEYRVLEIDGIRMNQYRTVYFDTPDFFLYRQHHNSYGSRYKVRTRQYVDSNLAFFEIKNKNNQGRTVKSRLPVEEAQDQVTGELDQFVNQHTTLDPDRLVPKLWNNYLRVTLVSKYRQERLTIDLNLTFGWGGKQVALPGVAIAEVKQKNFSHDSDFIQQMRTLGNHPTPFSKYCIGAGMIYKQLKTNNFKLNLQQLHKVMQEEPSYGFVY